MLGQPYCVSHGNVRAHESLRTGDPDKLQRAQPGTRSEIELVQQSATVQEKADRVLSRIRQKLRGDLSVEYQVNELIQEARDVENLSKIFIGALSPAVRCC